MKKAKHRILKSKLFPPKTPSDYVHRTDLKALLDHHAANPLIMITAPAGYGKSTLIASWLNSQEFSSCWISLNESENDFLRFIDYLIAAISQTVPQLENELVEITELENASSQSIMNAIFNCLIGLSEPLYIVLDDFHLITSDEIHNLINLHTEYPTAMVRFILISRIRPPIVVKEYKDNYRVFELGTSLLSFKPKHIVQYFKSSLGVSLSDSLAEKVGNQTDGWISGLKLITIQGGKTTDKAVFTNRLVINDLFKNFIASLNSDERMIILHASGLSEFSEDLLSHCLPEVDKNSITNTLNLLKKSNVFIINLDEGNNWYRFHHFFNDLLIEEFTRSVLRRERQLLFARAAAWFELNGPVEKAVQLHVKSGNLNQAYTLFAEQRIELLNNKNWSQIEFYELLFKGTEYKRRTESVLNQCWLDIYHGKVLDMFNKLPEIEQALDALPPSQETDDLRGEYYSLLLYRLYNLDHDYTKSLQICTDKLHLIPQGHLQAISLFWIFYGGSLQIAGRYKEALKILADELDKGPHSEIIRSLLLIECYLHYFEGNLDLLDRSSKNFLRLGEEQKSNQTIAEAHLFQGMFYYLIGNLEKAHQHFDSSYRRKEFIIGPHRLFVSTAISTTKLFLKGKDEFENFSSSTEDYFNLSGGQIYRNYWFTHQIELHAILEEKPEGFSSELPTEFPLMPISNHSDPNLSEIRWLLATNYEDGNLILAKIDRLESFVRTLNATKVTLSLQLARAVYLFHYEDAQQGLKHFEKAWRGIRKRNLIMLVAEYGYAVLPLLTILIRNKLSTDAKLQKVLALIDAPKTVKFTRRENDILNLLSESNKEIAQQLFISEKTVKRHKNSLYKKLGVKNVNEAITAAKKLNKLI